jgi:hypothetical protein
MPRGARKPRFISLLIHLGIMIPVRKGLYA